MDASTSISINEKICLIITGNDVDESDKHLYARNRRQSCLIFQIIDIQEESATCILSLYKAFLQRPSNHISKKSFKMNISEEMDIFLEIRDITLKDKILVSTIWFVLEIPCNIGWLGIIQFDRLGGDPVKRRVTDRVRKITFGKS